MARLKLGVLVSGSGTNLGAILDAVARDALDAEVRVVVSNKPGVRALDRAAHAGVPARVVSHMDFPDREAFDQRLIEVLREAEVSLVVMAGFMRVVTPAFLAAFPARVINIHPSLLPAFPGLHAPRQALAYGVKIAGCTVHYVDDGTDSGPVIAQAAVPVLDGDTEETLAARILQQEHRLLVSVLGALAQDEIDLSPAEEGGRPRVRSRDLAARLFGGA